MTAKLTPEADDLISKIMDARGATLLAFSQVEWFLAKVIVEASSFEQYQEIDLSFTQDAEKRAEKVRKLLNVNGPLSPHADKLRKTLDEVMKYTELRNFAAHGLLVRPEPDNFSLSSPIHLRMFRMYKGGVLTEDRRDLTLKEYTDEQTGLTSAARRFMELVRSIWKDLELKGLDPD